MKTKATGKMKARLTQNETQRKKESDIQLTGKQRETKRIATSKPCTVNQNYAKLS